MGLYYASASAVAPRHNVTYLLHFMIRRLLGSIPDTARSKFDMFDFHSIDFQISTGRRLMITDSDDFSLTRQKKKSTRQPS